MAKPDEGPGRMPTGLPLSNPQNSAPPDLTPRYVGPCRSPTFQSKNDHTALERFSLLPFRPPLRPMSNSISNPSAVRRRYFRGPNPFNPSGDGVEFSSCPPAPGVKQIPQKYSAQLPLRRLAATRLNSGACRGGQHFAFVNSQGPSSLQTERAGVLSDFSASSTMP